MKKFLLLLCVLVCALTVKAQKVVVSPLPQQITWGEKAFSNADINKVKITKGIVGAKNVKKYKNLVPQKKEAYYLKVTPTEIILVGHDADGLYYGEQTLAQITAQPEVMQCEVVDYPSVECRGVIEGFYGNPWSHQDRLRQFDFYGKNKMNIYVYGPKDDPYHRSHWREPYPEKEAKQLTELVNAAKKNHVQFVWAIHPGGDIQWNKQDSMNVVNKLEKMYELGVRTFAVFFDDIDGEGARGEKQAGLLNFVTDEFVHKHKDVKPLIMCPTVYNKAWSDDVYLPTLGKNLYKEVRIMWTGNSVVTTIDREGMEWINKQIGRKAFIWWNYPVNDFCQSRLLMGKTYGNDKDIDTLVSGFCSNPMEYAEASMVSLYSIADFTWNMHQYDCDSSWERCMGALMPSCKEAFHFFCENNVDLGVNGHKFRRDGESPNFNKNGNLVEYYNKLRTSANTLLADSINHPELIAEIKPWLESMDLLGQRGIASEQMADALQRNDSVEFIGLYRGQQQMERKQKAIVSRDFEGSIVKAKPLVSGDVVSPYVKNRQSMLVSEYRKNHTYGLEYLPLQPIEDGEYLIMVDGQYLTDAQADAKKTGDYPIFKAERDNINPQRQQWMIEWDYNTERYKITNKQDGRYLCENGAFRKNSWFHFDSDEHTYIIAPQGEGFTIQCADKGGNGFWVKDGERIKTAETPITFTLTPMK